MHYQEENGSEKPENNLESSKFSDKNFYYLPLRATLKEPEYQGELLPISSVGAESTKNMLPSGSAILTGSGDLEKQGIKAIIHACSGSIKKENQEFQPTIQGIIRSVQNSILLAERNNYKSIAFCLIGSNSLDSIFPPNQGTKRKRQGKLAEIIIRAATEQRKKIQKIVFVDFGNLAFKKAFFKIGDSLPKAINFTKGVVNNNSDFSATDKNEKRGILDYSLHKCEVIVNSLNIEGEFINSGSFSGFIARQTGSAKNDIQKIIQKNITEFNSRVYNSIDNHE